jgi:hypothetical protein
MSQKLQDIRSQIALLDLQVTELQSLQNIVRVKREEARRLGTAKIQKIKGLIDSKLAGVPPQHPKHKLIADKLAAMQLLLDQRITVIADEYTRYQDQIDTLSEQSASRTKEMLTLVT